VTESKASLDTSRPETQRPDEAVMRGVIPYLNLRGRAGDAADFYVRAFGATEMGRLPDPEAAGRYMHVQVEINRGALMMTDMGADAADAGVRNAHMQLIVRDGRAWWDRAVGAGCRVVEPYAMQFWGDEWGLVEDPFGVRWAILEPGPEQHPREDRP
jgi:PhnB protein